MPPKKKTTEQFIKEATELHGEKYDYSKSVYTGALKKLEVICPKHGSFYPRPSDHLSGSGCKQCFVEGRRYEFSEVVKQAKEKHGNKYTYKRLDVDGVRVFIVFDCPLHGEQRQNVYNHCIKAGANGCNVCAYGVRRQSLALTLEEVLQRATIVHSGRYDYSLITSYHNTRDTVKIVCPTHGEFGQNIGHHLLGTGCEKCARKYVAGLFGYTQETFIEKCKEVHGDKYDYSKLFFESTKKDITVVCNEHEDFTQNARTHMRGAGCPKCASSNKRLYLVSKQREDNKETLLSNRAYVYVIAMSSFGKDIYKIGVSRNPESRVWGIKSSLKGSNHALDCVIVYQKEFNEYKAYCLEAEIHNLLTEYKHTSAVNFEGQTEIFNLSQEEVKTIINLLEDEKSDIN